MLRHLSKATTNIWDPLKICKRWSPDEKMIQEMTRKFAQQDCEHTIEFEKLEESADILGTEFSEYEKEVLEKSRKEQNKLYVIGAVVLLIGAYIIIK